MSLDIIANKSIHLQNIVDSQWPKCRTYGARNFFVACFLPTFDPYGILRQIWLHSKAHFFTNF